MPVLNGWAGFIIAREFDPGTEHGGTGLALDAPSQLFGHTVESRGGNRGQVALPQLGLEPLQLFRQGFEPLLFGSEHTIDKILPLDRAKILDEVLVLVTPEDQRAL